MRLPLLTRRLHKEYYEKENRAPTTFNVSPMKVAAADLRRVFSSTRKADVDFVEHLAARPWKMIDREKLQFKVNDKPFDYDVQFYIGQAGQAKNDRLAKFILSGRGTATLPIVNMDFVRMPKSLSEKLGGFGVTVQGGGAMNLSEHFFKKYSARQHLQKYPGETKAFIFNVINSLRDYKDQYPNFVHGSLDLDHVEVYPFNSSFHEDTPAVQVGGSTFVPPSPAGKVMIGGFGSSSFTGDASPSKDVSSLIQSIADTTGDSKLGALAKRMVNKHTFEAIMTDEYFKEFRGGGKKMFGGEEEDEDEEEEAGFEDEDEDEDEDDDLEKVKSKKKKPIEEEEEEEEDEKEEEDDDVEEEEEEELGSSNAGRFSWLEDDYGFSKRRPSSQQQAKPKRNPLYNILGADAILNGSRDVDEGVFGHPQMMRKQAQDYGMMPYTQNPMMMGQQPMMGQPPMMGQQQYPMMGQQQYPYQPGTGMAGLQAMQVSSLPQPMSVSAYHAMMPQGGGGGGGESAEVQNEAPTNLSEDDFFFQANPIR